MIVDAMFVLAELVIVGLAVVLGISIGSRRRRELDEFEADEFITRITTDEDEAPAWQAPPVRQVITASTYLSDDGSCIDWVRDAAPVGPGYLTAPVRIDAESDRFAAAMARADAFIASLRHEEDVALPAAVQ